MGFHSIISFFPKGHHQRGIKGVAAHIVDSCCMQKTHTKRNKSFLKVGVLELDDMICFQQTKLKHCTPVHRSVPGLRVERVDTAAPTQTTLAHRWISAPKSRYTAGVSELVAGHIHLCQTCLVVPPLVRVRFMKFFGFITIFIAKRTVLYSKVLCLVSLLFFFSPPPGAASIQRRLHTKHL